MQGKNGLFFALLELIFKYQGEKAKHLLSI
jgi:hypothetical protein